MVVIDVTGGLLSVTSVNPKSSVFCIFLCIIDVNLRIILSYVGSSKEACVVGLQTSIVVSSTYLDTYYTYGVPI